MNSFFFLSLSRNALRGGLVPVPYLEEDGEKKEMRREKLSKGVRPPATNPHS